MDSIVKSDLIPAEELKDGGYLQEVNRRFFHPLGLALSVSSGLTRDDIVEALDSQTPIPFSMKEEGKPTATEVRSFVLDYCEVVLRSLGLDEPHVVGVHDGRDDPDGVVFVDEEGTAPLILADDDSIGKAQHVEEEWAQRGRVRNDRLGFNVQRVLGVDG